MAEIVSDEHAMLRPGLGRLKGKVAIITGANSGIGRATARLFGREAAKVVCCDIQETISPRIDQLIKEKEGGEAVFATIDVTKQEDCDRMIKTALDSFGDVDILYNNAGAGIRKKLHEHTDEEWNFVINTNLDAMFRGARAVLPHFIETPRFRGFPPRPTLGEGMTDEQRKTMGASNKALLRMGRPEEIAYGVLFLVSEEASFVTGHALVVDGGQTIDA